MSDAEHGRRSVLARFVMAGLALMGTGLAGLVALVAAPPQNRSVSRWRPVMSMFDLPPRGPTPAIITERRADGWYQTRRQSVVFVDRADDGYRVLAATCTHLGCRVRWDEDADRFRCPCHGGVYDREGRVVEGPPPGPLRRLSVRVNEQTAEIEVEL